MANFFLETIRFFLHAILMFLYYFFQKSTWCSTHRFLYAEDGLISFKNSDFLEDPRFVRAYKEGCIAAGDYHWRWRAYIGIWSGSYASQLDGDFVECGVSYGFLSTAVMSYLNWNELNKVYYLLDTFCGLDPNELSEEEKASVGRIYDHAYPNCYEQVKKNFARYKNVHIIRGTVPHTLKQVMTEKISFLSIDMNCANPEVAALDFFWDRLVKGAIVLFDDYAHRNHEAQKMAIDRFCSNKNAQVLSLPTGQGFLIKH